MKAYRVGIPCMIVEASEELELIGGAHEPPKAARMLYFRVVAENEDQAAQILWERLEPTCGDP